MDDGWNWAREVIVESNYNEWFKEKYRFSPNHTYCGIRTIDELVSMRDEYMGLKGETGLIRILKKDGMLEVMQKETMKTYRVITLEEYIKEYIKEYDRKKNT